MIVGNDNVKVTGKVTVGALEDYRYRQLVELIMSRLVVSKERLELLRGFRAFQMDYHDQLPQKGPMLDAVYNALYASLYISIAAIFDKDDEQDSNSGKAFFAHVGRQLTTADPRYPEFVELDARWNLLIAPGSTVDAVMAWRHKAIAHNTTLGYHVLCHLEVQLTFRDFQLVIDDFSRLFSNLCGLVENSVIVNCGDDRSVLRNEFYELLDAGGRELSGRRP